MRSVQQSAAAILVLFIFGAVIASAADSPTVIAAKKRAADTQSELSKANTAVAAIIHKARLELESSVEWKRAAADLREAEAHQANVTKAARDKLRKDPEYQAAATARYNAQTKRDALREQPNPPLDQLAQAAADLLNASGVVTRLETQALASDPRVAEATAKVNDARIRLDDLLKTLPDLTKKDPGFEAARQRVQSASSAAADANKQLAQAKAQQETADEQKMNQDVDTRRDQMRNITGFRR